MNLKFYAPDLSDKRIEYAAEYLEKAGFFNVNCSGNADFILLGVNPDKSLLEYDKPIFAGNVKESGAYDYTKSEAFAIENAYLTAEGALSLAINESDISLINSEILITGYGRIGKALLKYLCPFTNNISVCARRKEIRKLAECNGAKAIDFPKLKEKNNYDFIFNTVCHPVFNYEEIKALESGAVMIELASFPGGIDRHVADKADIKLINAGGLPAKYSPKSAGKVLANTVIDMTKEVFD